MCEYRMISDSMYDNYFAHTAYNMQVQKMVTEVFSTANITVLPSSSFTTYQDVSDCLYMHYICAYMFTTEGEYLGKFGRSEKQVLNLRGVAVDKTGNVYVCDVDCGEVLVSRP